MKKLLLIALALLGTLTVQAHTQDSTKKVKLTAEQKAEKLTQRMKKQLDLSDSQVVLVQSINLEHAKAMEALKASDTEGKERKTQMDALNQSYHDKLAKVLTTEQLEKFKKQAAKAKQKHKKEKGKKKKNGNYDDGDVEESED